MEVDPITFFDNYYSTRAYQKTYCWPLIPISIENLVPDQSIKPPIIQKQAGRPKTKPIRKEVWHRKQTCCGNCLDWGHNRRRCTGQPALSGRRERARDSLEEIQVDKEEGEESEDKEDSEEENENEAIPEEEDEQEDEQNSESDSELSQIASSQFDRMELDQEEKVVISFTRSRRTRR